MGSVCGLLFVMGHKELSGLSLSLYSYIETEWLKSCNRLICSVSYLLGTFMEIEAS